MKKLTRQLAMVILPSMIAWILPYLPFNHFLGINFNISANAFIFKIIGLILSIVFFGMLFVKLSFEKIEKWIIKHEKWVVVGITSAVALLIMVITFNQQLHFNTHAFDFGIYNHAAWQYGQLRFGYFEDLVGIKKMADHFEPILIIPGFLNWIVRSPYILLAFEAIVVAAGFVPVYLIGKKLLKSHLAAVLIGLAYLSFMGVQSAVGYPVHPGTWLATFYGFMLYFAIEKKFIWYYVFLGLALCCKESAAIDLLFIGLFIGLVLKERKHGLITIGLGAVWYVLSIKWLMPALNGGQPYVHGVFGNISNNPAEFIKFIVSHPIKAAQIMFDQPVKGQTFWLTLGSSGFLTILSPAFILLVFPMLFERLVTEHPGMITMQFHYSIPVAIMLMVSAILSIRWLSGKFKVKNLTIYLAGYMLACSFLLAYRFGTPLVVFKSWNNFKMRPIDRAGYEMLKAVPANASIVAQESLIGHLSYRDKVQMFGGGIPGGYKYVLLSKDENFPAWPVSGQVVTQSIVDLRKDKDFKLVKENQYFVLFKDLEVNE